MKKSNQKDWSLIGKVLEKKEMNEVTGGFLGPSGCTTICSGGGFVSITCDEGCQSGNDQVSCVGGNSHGQKKTCKNDRIIIAG